MIILDKERKKVDNPSTNNENTIGFIMIFNLFIAQR